MSYFHDCCALHVCGRIFYLFHSGLGLCFFRSRNDRSNIFVCRTALFHPRKAIGPTPLPSYFFSLTSVDPLSFFFHKKMTRRKVFSQLLLLTEIIYMQVINSWVLNSAGVFFPHVKVMFVGLFNC